MDAEVFLSDYGIISDHGERGLLLISASALAAPIDIPHAPSPPPCNPNIPHNGAGFLPACPGAPKLSELQAVKREVVNAATGKLAEYFTKHPHDGQVLTPDDIMPKVITNPVVSQPFRPVVGIPIGKQLLAPQAAQAAEGPIQGEVRID